MKKLVSILAITSISSFAATIPSSMTSVANEVANNLKICAKTSSNDATKEATFTSDPNKCFNAYDIPFTSSTGTTTSPVSLSTKTAGKDFIFKITKKPTCIVNNVTYSLVDNKTGNEIPGTTNTITNPADANFAQFNVSNSYKDVSVKFSYKKTVVNTSSTPTEVTCPTSTSDYTIVTSYNDIPQTTGIFAVPQQECYQFTYSSVNGFAKQKTSCPLKPTIVSALPAKPSTSTTYAIVSGYKCYKYPTTSSSIKVDYSTDNFAIKPSQFDITLKKSPIKVGQVEPMDLKVLNNNSIITTNYKNSSTNLIVTLTPSNTKAQYGFDINNGVLSKSVLSFATTNSDVSMKILDEHYADVDSDDTFQTCRNIEGTSNTINIIGTSKYWAGTGTNEKENNPTNNTISSEVKQNTKKDVHFQKLGW